jgi:glycosyltransferase involved in cell wall biosynthesis
MHIPWGWIKQRPHFFAEYLHTEYGISVYYKRAIKVSRKYLKTGNTSKLRISSFFVFPFNKIPFIRRFSSSLNFINNLLLWIQLPSIKKQDIVWVTNWMMYKFVKTRLAERSRLIYDCMDDELEFPVVKNNSLLLKEAAALEQALVDRADAIICSSMYLKHKLQARTNSKKEIFVINNAIAIPHKTTKNAVNVLNGIELKNSFIYAGTISSWFDFNTVLYFLNAEKQASFILIGPKDIPIPNHPRLHYFGTMVREELFPVMQGALSLVMPFKVNELVRSVNPVKLYEYIYCSKPIIVSRYSETELFGDYVYLYENEKDFLQLGQEVLQGKKYEKNTRENNEKFALANTWECRFKQVSNVLSYFKKDV